MSKLNYITLNKLIEELKSYADFYGNDDVRGFGCDNDLHRTIRLDHQGQAFIIYIPIFNK
jgi:hypothetical protein